jgi:hypothetical protein
LRIRHRPATRMLFPTSEPVPRIIRFFALAITFVLRTFQSLTELTENSESPQSGGAGESP